MARRVLGETKAQILDAVVDGATTLSPPFGQRGQKWLVDLIELGKRCLVVCDCFEFLSACGEISQSAVQCGLVKLIGADSG